jgi:hypothetical protein
MPQRTIRFSETTIKQIRQTARKKGFTSTAIIRLAVEQALGDGEEVVERRVITAIEQIQNDLLRMQRVNQTLFAFVDTLAKALLTGLPEQSSASVARGRERYELFLKSVAASTVNGSHPLLPDRVER